MLSKKQVIASVLLCAMIGMSAGCQGEQGPLLNPITGKPFSEQDLFNAQRYWGLSVNPTQKELNELQTKRTGRSKIHPKALAAETAKGLKEYLRKNPSEAATE